MSSGNGRHASIELVNEKIRALRWESRCYALILFLGLVSNHFGVPQTATHVALGLFR